MSLVCFTKRKKEEEEEEEEKGVYKP